MKQEERRLIQDKYEIVSKIKQGGFGIVYKGYDHVFEKEIAIKAIEPGLLREAKYIDLFLEEAKNAGKLSHNNIVHIYNLVRDESGQFFIIMEYVNGVDLGNILRQCRKKNIIIPQELSVFIVKEVCKALEYAHNKRDLITDKPLRLVHQDISPSNIMTSRLGQVKLIDFGLAKIRFENNNSKEVVISGKLPYMAPEQVNGGIIDRRTDIFSLGTVFYELLTGSRLFPLDDPHQTIDLIKKSKIEMSLLKKRNVSQSVQNVLLKMLKKNPDNRYLGANGVYLDLVECLMSSAHSVELSDDLGDFVRELIDTNGAIEIETSGGIAPGKPGEASSIEPQVETVQDVPGKVEDKQGAAETDQFEIKEPELGTADLTDDSEQAIAETSDESGHAGEDVGAGTEIELQDSTVSTGDSGTIPLAEAADTVAEEIKRTSVEKPGISPELQPDSTGIEQHDADKKLADVPISTKDEAAMMPLDSATEKSGEALPIMGADDEAENVELANVNQSIIETKIEQDNKPTAPETIPAIYADEEGEDDLKTVIDVIRLSTSRHKKVLTIGGLSVLSAIVLFFILDIMLQLTSFGEGIYNRLFPPAIRINSLPAGASIYLDNKQIPGKTPLSIPKITPGVHELKLTYSGFNPLIKSIHVPSKGEVKVAGENIRKGYDPYLFKFKSQVDVISDPVGATIYINQLLYPQKTPATVEWETGTPLSIELEQDGFQKLSGFTLNTLDGIEEIEDRRLWSFHTTEGEAKKYIVEGLFKKFMTISCIPSGVNFYIDGSATPSGRTDVANTIALSMGKHEIVFRKTGFNSRRVRLNVDKNSSESISVMLTRNVRFFAKDKNDLGNNEIGATIVRIIQNRRSYRRNDKTPCEISLPPVNLQVVLNKEGYKEAVVGVTPRDNDVVVKMEPSFADVEIIVKDALTDLPLKGAQLSYRSLVNNRAADIYFGATDEKGVCTNKLAPGEYSFRVKKFGYFEKYAILNTSAGKNKLEFKLIIQ